MERSKRGQMGRKLNFLAYHRGYTMPIVENGSGSIMLLRIWMELNI